MSAPDLTDREFEAVLASLRSGALSLGPRIVEFEAAIARYCGMPHAVGVNSGTSALHLAVIAAGLQDDHLAITSPYSFVASANSLLYERAIPIFVDVDAASGNIDPALVEEASRDLCSGTDRAIRWLPRSLRAAWRPGRHPLKALLPVHTFGQPADMAPLVATARTYGLHVIEDACEAIGAEYNGQPAGSFGDAAVFAFYPNKQMTTGEGGMIVTCREDWQELFRSLRNQGRDKFDTWMWHSRLGYNYRLDEMSAAVGCVQVERLDELIAKRARVAGWYSDRLSSSLDLVTPPTVAATTTRMSWFVYVVRLAPSIDRDGLMRDLDDGGIPSRPYFMPIHLQSFYQARFGYEPGDFPIAEDLGRRSLALPFSSVMTEEQVEFVCAQLLARAKMHDRTLA